MPRKSIGKSRIDTSSEPTTGPEGKLHKVTISYFLPPSEGEFADLVTALMPKRMLGFTLGLPPLYFLYLFTNGGEGIGEGGTAYRILTAIATVGNPIPPGLDLDTREYVARGLAFYLALYRFISGHKGFESIARRAEELAPVIYDFIQMRIGTDELESFFTTTVKPKALPSTTPPPPTEGEEGSNNASNEGSNNERKPTDTFTIFW